MLLAVDIGNSSIKLGLFDDATLVERWQLPTFPERTADEVGALLADLFARRGRDPGRVHGVVVSSVVPSLTLVVRMAGKRLFRADPFVVESDGGHGMPVSYDPPDSVGTDRLVNAIAAYERYGRGRHQPLIVCALGTATTIDAVSADGKYLGGAIAPGLTISADALFERTARLPRVDVRKPDRVVGQSTVGAIQAGVFWGYVGMVEGLIGRMKKELGGSATCVATGGLATLIAPETTLIEHVDANLTLEGLRLVWERNRTAAK